MKTIVVTGVPGTGKTTIAKKLAKKLNYYYVDVNKLIVKHKFSEGYDKKRKTRIVDVGKLNRFSVNYIKQLKTQKNKPKGIIIDSHLSHYLPRKYVDACIVAKCDIKELNRRLKRKKFHKAKVQENLQAEIFDVCYNEAIERKHKVIVIDTTKGFNINKVAKQLGG
ncbi:adenylate kinase family protein [Candidatus Woesearchaeota archaeon]|nr:adenylate kinase family protein [Candidatus Woesearchaeota archaeon]